MTRVKFLQLLKDVTYTSLFYTYAYLGNKGGNQEKVCLVHIIGKRNETYVVFSALIGEISGFAAVPPVQRADLLSDDELDGCIIHSVVVPSFKLLFRKKDFKLRTDKIKFPEGYDAAKTKEYVTQLIHNKKAPLPTCLLSCIKI